MNPIFIGNIKKGKLILENPDRFSEYLFSLNDKVVRVVVSKMKKSRSRKENRYYWGVAIKLLSDHTGYSRDEMHDALRMLFLRNTDKKIPTIRSTASLTTIEFESYLTEIRQWAAQELDCYIPVPNEVEI